MKKRMKTTPKDASDYYLRLRVSPQLKGRLKVIASRRAVGAGSRPVTVSDVARDFLIEGAEKERAA